MTRHPIPVGSALFVATDVDGKSIRYHPVPGGPFTGSFNVEERDDGRELFVSALNGYRVDRDELLALRAGLYPKACVIRWEREDGSEHVVRL